MVARQAPGPRRRQRRTRRGLLRFVYIAATDLLPQITRRESVQEKVVHTLLLFAGLGLLWVSAAAG